MRLELLESKIPDNFIQRYLDLAATIATWSKDPRKKVGAVLVSPNNSIISTGYNGFPRDMYDPPSAYEDREYKKARVVHAEMNAILQAARNGVRVEDSVLFVTLFPCRECAKAIANSGISEVHYRYSNLDSEYMDTVSSQIFNACNIKTYIYHENVYK